MRRSVRFLAGLAVAVCMTMTAGTAMADQSGPKFKLGVGTYALIVADDSSRANSVDDGEFYGGALVGTACFTKHIAVRGALYSTENDDYSGLDVSGLDLQLLLGTNFYEGWNLFGGVGYFTETWEVSEKIYGYTISADKDFSGAQLSFGVGYSWSKVALDYVMNVRDTSDYEDFSGIDHDYAVSGGITLSYIF